jgi:hypothetical protein
MNKYDDFTFKENKEGPQASFDLFINFIKNKSHWSAL